MDFLTAKNNMGDYKVNYLLHQNIFNCHLEVIHKAIELVQDHYLVWSEHLGKEKCDWIEQKSSLLAVAWLTTEQAKEICFLYHANPATNKEVWLVTKSVKLHLCDVLELAEPYTTVERKSLLRWLGISLQTWHKLAWQTPY